jgi:tetratricopeptide (TPR) repeat protein
MHIACACATGLLVLSAALPATARQSDEELAKRFFKLGSELYTRSAYAEALKNFQKSYEYSKKPALIYNMGRCYESIGKPAEAIEHYRRFLATKPKDEALIRAKIEHLQVQLGRESGGGRDAPEGSPAASRPLRTAGWVSLGVGGASLITGVVLGALAGAKSSELEEANTAGKEYADLQAEEDAGRALQTGQIVTLAIGGAAVVTGAVLLFLDSRRGSSTEEKETDEAGDDLAISPTVLPGGGGLSCRLRF